MVSIRDITSSWALVAGAADEAGVAGGDDIGTESAVAGMNPARNLGPSAFSFVCAHSLELLA